MDQQDDPDPFAGLQEWAEQAERRVRRERRLGGLRRKALLIAGLAVAAALVVVAVPVVRSWLPASSPAVAGQSPGKDRPTASTAAGVSAVTSAVAAPTDPFAGTPAATYPKGAAGISLPVAESVTGFNAAQVQAALKQVRAALIAGRLAPGMLVGHDSGRLLKLLAPNDRDQVGKWFKATTFSTVATWIDPAVRLDPREQPRVSGRITYAAVRVDGLATLRVTTNFVWVYAFTGVDHRLAVAHDEIQWEFPSTENLRAGDRGMWIGKTKAYTALIDCAAEVKGLLAPTRPGEGKPADPAEEENAYLRADHQLDIGDDC